MARHLLFLPIMFLFVETRANETLREIADRASAAYSAGQFDEAAVLYETLVRWFPHVSSARIALARAYARGGEAARALDALEHASNFGVRFDPVDEAWRVIAGAGRFHDLVDLMEARTTPIVRSEPAFLLEKDLVPENLAYDRETGSFFVGSMYKAKILRIDPDGSVTDFVPSRRDGLLSVLGMKVDAASRELWALSGNFVDRPPLEEPDPTTEGKGMIHRFDLDDGALLRAYPARGWSKENPVWFNDLVLGPDGTAYITAGAAGIYRLTRESDHPEPFVAADAGFFNGITISPDGSTLFVAAHLEGVLAIDLASREQVTLSVPAGVTLEGIDGLYFHEGSLIAIQNGTDPSRVIRAWLDHDRKRVTRFAVLEQGHPLSDLPLTGTVVGGDLFYVARSQLRAFEDGKIWPMDRLKETVILRLPIELPGIIPTDPEQVRASLLEMHRNEVRAHFERDAEWIARTTGDTFVSASSGRIDRAFREDVRRFFTGYFEGATYIEYEDLEPPVVGVSDDGSMGWVLSRTRVRRVKEGEERNFVYAGIMTYVKRDGEWVRIVNVSTFEP